MVLSITAALLLAPSLAEDLLFINTLQYHGYTEATGPLGKTAKVVTETEWRAMTTADFAVFKAIVIADPDCGGIGQIQFLSDTKAVWSPAILGNIILICKCCLFCLVLVCIDVYMDMVD
jgi:hypothetical protein